MAHERLPESAVKLQRLERLSELTREMMGRLGTTTLEDQLQRIAEAAREIVGAESCGIFLVKDRDHDLEHLSLEASAGHHHGRFQRGLRLPIQSDPGGGITSHIASQGALFNAFGDVLINHFAVGNRRNLLDQHHPADKCYSLLALPLKRKSEDREDLVGLLRLDNKLDENGEALTDRGFDSVDEWITHLFADVAVAAIENAELVHYKTNLINSCPSGIIAVDRDGNVTEYNPSAEEIIGRPRHQVLGTPVSEIYFDPTEPRRIGSLLSAGDGLLTNRATAVKSITGESIPILHSATWLLSGGRRIGSVGYFNDMRLTQRLERREKLFKSIDVLARATDLEQGLQEFTAQMVSLLGRSYCAVLLMDEGGEFLSLRAASRSDRDDWRPTPGTRVAVAGSTGLSEILAIGRPALWASDDERYRLVLQRLSKSIGFERRLHSLLIVPLKIEDRVVGQLDFGERQRERRAPFGTKEEHELIVAIAAQLAVLMDRWRLIELTREREKRLSDLARLAPQLRAQTETATFLQQAASLAADLVNYEVGGIFVRYLNTNRFELTAVHGLPPSVINVQADGAQMIAKVAETGESQRSTSLSLIGAKERFDLRETLAVPLRGPTGIVESILFVANKKQPGVSDSVDRDVLERFAFHAAIGLRASRLLGDEYRTAGRLEILHSISDYILQTTDDDKLFHAFLTGVTASYGLRFNRAFLFLIDDSGFYLVGKSAIGELDDTSATAAWRQDDQSRLNDFGRYRDRLESGEISLTTIDAKIRGLHFDLDSDDLFAETVRKSQYRIVEPAEFHRVPELFRSQFGVTSPLVIAPLRAKGKVLGLLIVDNKFTRTPIEATSTNALMAFANTAAIALDNHSLVVEASGHDRLLKFYGMSSALAAMSDPDLILRAIADQTLQAANAWGVSVLLYDERTCQFRCPTSVGGDLEADPQDTIRRGETAEVMTTGQAILIENTSRGRSNRPEMVEKGIEAALCLPLSLLNRRMGVIWIHFDRPRRLSDSLVVPLQLFLNQAAVAYDHTRRIRALESIRAAAEALTAIDDVPGVLARIVDSALLLFQADAAVLWLYDAEDQRFLPERSVARGIELELWDLRSLIAADIATCDDAMEEGWIAISDAEGAEGERLDKGTRSMLQLVLGRGLQAVALKAGQEKLGVLYTIYKQPLSVDDDQRLTAEEFGNHAAWSLKKARLLERVTRAKAAARIVAEVAASGERSPNTLKMIAEQAKDALKCAAIVLFENNENGIVHPPATAGVRDLEAIEHPEEKRDYDLVEATLKLDEPRLVPRVADEDDFKNRRFVKAEGIRSCAAIPLRAAGHAVGAMFVNYRVNHDFTSEEVDDIKLFANQSAVAIRAAQLFETLNRKLEEQEALVKELQDAREVTKARTALALIGLRTIAWVHNLGTDLAEALGEIWSLRRALADSGQLDLVPELDQITELVKKIGKAPQPSFDEPDERVFDLLEEVLEPFVKDTIGNEGLGTIVFESDIDLPERPRVKASSWWLLCVIGYAVNNALEAVRRVDGEQRITLKAWSTSDRAHIQISDNGPGIPARIRSPQ